MSNYSSFKYLEDPNMPWHKIIDHIEEKSRVLDVGCSSGNLGNVLKIEKKCEVIGLDLDSNDVALAKNKLDGAYVLNIETDNIGFLGKFDYVIFADVIEHLIDPVGALVKTKELLNDDGTVLFSIPNMAHMGTRLMLMGGKFRYGEIGLLDKTHIHFYDHEEVGRVFASAGYNFVEFDWIERYIPKYLLIQQLKDIGLKPDNKFLERSKMVEAIAYEYVGKAQPSKSISKLKTKLDFISPYVLTVEERIEQLQKSHDNDIANLQASLAAEEDRYSKLKEKYQKSISGRSRKIAKKILKSKK